MARAPTYSVSTSQRQVSGQDDLKESLIWFNSLLPKTAHEELAEAQRQGSLQNPTTFVDGKKGRDEESVKPFGNITYADSIGPLREAIEAAQAFVERAAPRKTGWYRESLQWLANGQLTMDAPNAERVGARGNVQLVDLAPYASVVEIDVPRGVIYGAYTMLKRKFGKQLIIAYSYMNPQKVGGLHERPGNPARVPYAIPVLTIGSPGSTVKPTNKRPGYNQRRHGEKAGRESRGKRAWVTRRGGKV